MQAANILDPRLYAEVRKPLDEAQALPSWCYTDADFYRQELDHIFLRQWTLLGREEELPKSGDYRVFDRYGQSMILIREKSGRLGGFMNYCRHRGTRLLDGSGNAKAIVCPYHSWSYGTSGQLLATPGMNDLKCFEKSDWGLAPVRVETWAGFVFVNFDKDAPPLAAQVGDFDELFAGHAFGSMRLTRRIEYRLDCNWKLFVENAMEDYHTPTVHKGSIGLQQTNTISPKSGEWSTIWMECKGTIGILPGETTSFPAIETLSEDARQRSYFALLFPAMFLGVTTDCMWYLNSIPTGPKTMLLEVGSCFPESTISRPDFAETVQKYYRRWDKSIPEDNAISERQQLGLNLYHGPSGRLSLREPVVHTIANWVLDKLPAAN